MAALWWVPATAQPAPEPPAFLAGCWEQRDGDKLVQEQWMAPAAGLMLGVGRTLRGSRLLGWEHMLIEVNATGMHFVASPSGKSSTRFAQVVSVVSDLQSVEFSNPAHGFPSHVRYRLASPNELHAQISGLVNGQERRIDFRYQKVACP